MMIDTKKAAEVLKNQLFRELLKAGDTARSSDWFATNRFSEASKRRKSA